MSPRQRLRPQRQLLFAFAAVAVVSVAALGWLGWMLFEQDTILETQRRQERLEQAADRALAVMQRALSELQSRASSPPDTQSPPTGVATFVSLPAAGSPMVRSGTLPFVPARPERPVPPSSTFAAGETLEFARQDLPAAAAAYAQLTKTADVDTRAGALARLARVERKRGRAADALRAYDALGGVEADVAGLPAGLVASTGRASVLEAEGKVERLKDEGRALLADLDGGRWALVRAEYDFYRTQAVTWLGERIDVNADATARAEAVAWLWDNRASLPTRQPRLVAMASGPALIAWRPAADGVEAVVAGPAFIATLCASAVTGDLRCGLTDNEGRLVTGERPSGRRAGVRPAAIDGLPWTLYVSEPPLSGPSGTSPRRRLLLLAFGVVALVLAAGWYFIVRAMSRERRVARLQSDFIDAVSHEFRSPLTSMSHVAELLASDRLSSDIDRRRSYGVLLRETDRLRRLVEGLLDFGRFEAGGATLRVEDANVPALVRSTVAEFEQRMEPDGCTIQVSAAREGIHATVDIEALGRALWNLLDNAVKYSPGGREVSVDVTSNASRVSITVSDQGIGIPPHEQRQIFDRFARGSDATTRRIKGTGIGLTMVRDIMRAHGGDVHVSSEPGRGSAFTLTLPPSPRQSPHAQERMLPSVNGSR